MTALATFVAGPAFTTLRFRLAIEISSLDLLVFIRLPVCDKQAGEGLTQH
jgi:hypothetical protein